MQEGFKKIKTLFDFGEIDESFEDALAEMDVNDPVDGQLNHGIIWWETWTDQQLEDFADMVWDTAEQLCHTLIGNNIRYNSAYWWIRKACKEKYGDASIPYFVHTYEKTLRSWNPGDNEDSELDKVGYELLEYVCRKLDKKWSAEPPVIDGATEGVEGATEGEIDLLMQMDCAVPEFGEERSQRSEPQHASRAFCEEPEIPQCLGVTQADIDNDVLVLKEISDDKIEVIPVKQKHKTCVQCGCELVGNQTKFCSLKCNGNFTSDARREAMRKIESCE